MYAQTKACTVRHTWCRLAMSIGFGKDVHKSGKMTGPKHWWHPTWPCFLASVNEPVVQGRLQWDTRVMGQQNRFFKKMASACCAELSTSEAFAAQEPDGASPVSGDWARLHADKAAAAAAAAAVFSQLASAPSVTSASECVLVVLEHSSGSSLMQAFETAADLLGGVSCGEVSDQLRSAAGGAVSV